MELTHFIYGKFFKRPEMFKPDAKILAADPPSDSHWSALRTEISDIVEWLSKDQGRAWISRLLFPRSDADTFVYVRVFPSELDDVRRPLISYHAIVLPTKTLRIFLDWQPWRLDRILPTRLGKYELEGPGVLAAQVNVETTSRQVEPALLKLTFEPAALPDAAVNDAELSRRAEQLLGSGKNVALIEDHSGAVGAGKAAVIQGLAGALLKNWDAAQLRLGVALGLSADIESGAGTWLQAHGIRLLSVGSTGKGPVRVPDRSWKHLRADSGTGPVPIITHARPNIAAREPPTTDHHGWPSRSEKKPAPAPAEAAPWLSRTASSAGTSAKAWWSLTAWLRPYAAVSLLAFALGALTSGFLRGGALTPMGPGAVPAIQSSESAELTELRRKYQAAEQWQASARHLFQSAGNPDDGPPISKDLQVLAKSLFEAEQLRKSATEILGQPSITAAALGQEHRRQEAKIKKLTVTINQVRADAESRLQDEIEKNKALDRQLEKLRNDSAVAYRDLETAMDKKVADLQAKALKADILVEQNKSLEKDKNLAHSFIVRLKNQLDLANSDRISLQKRVQELNSKITVTFFDEPRFKGKPYVYSFGPDNSVRLQLPKMNEINCDDPRGLFRPDETWANPIKSIEIRVQKN